MDRMGLLKEAHVGHHKHRSMHASVPAQIQLTIIDVAEAHVSGRSGLTSFKLDIYTGSHKKKAS